MTQLYNDAEMDLTQRMGVDWEELRQAVLAGQKAPIEQYASDMLASGSANYRVVQRALEEFLFRQVRPFPSFYAGPPQPQRSRH